MTKLKAKKPRWEKRFLSKIKKTNKCWLWTRSKDKGGYGRFYIEGKTYLSHRVSWALHNHEIKQSVCCLHKCDNPSCVNPNHLFIGSISDNNKDMAKKKRNQRGPTHWTRRMPERLSRGTSHGTHTHPERISRGESHGEKVSIGWKNKTEKEQLLCQS